MPVTVDLTEMDYSLISKAMGCHAIRVSDPAKLAGAFEEGFANTSSPTVIDVVVTRNPGRMLPSVDNRTLKAEKGDHPV